MADAESEHGEAKAECPESERMVNAPSELEENMDNTTSSGCNPIFINSFTYVGTVVFFIVFIEIPSLATLPFPFNKSMLVSSNADFADNKLIKYWYTVLWAAHFIRRTLEVIFVHRYNRRMPIVECVGAPIYYWFFAVWIAWSMRYDSGYRVSYNGLVITGSVIFLLGEIGNCTCHVQLRNFRNETRPNLISNTSRHVLPHGFLFNIVSCPHYSCEIISWAGYFLATWTLASLVFLLATTITLVFYSYKKHKAYSQEFDGENGNELYPANRKALIPFVF